MSLLLDQDLLVEVGLQLIDEVIEHPQATAALAFHCFLGCAFDADA
tara:strand:+ start:12997 stop:13134 length:138 start_codon:yes stop_codon:yes gene_type:complete